MELAQAALADIESSGLDRWISDMSAELSRDVPPCEPADVLLTPEELQVAASLADVVAGELIVNLDAAMGAAAERCNQGESDAALEEFADARTIGRQLRERLEYLES